MEYDSGVALTRRLLLQATALAASAVAAGPRLLARAAAVAAPVGQWAAGDAHVHTDHSSDGSLPRQGLDRGGPGDTSVRSQIALGTAGGLDWMSLNDHRTYTQHWDPQWTSDLLLLLPGEEAQGKPHATVVGAIDTLVDGAHPKGSAEFRHMQQSVWDVHAQDAVWGTAHPQDGEYDSTGPGKGKVNANASTIGIDTVEGGNRVVDPDPDLDYCENRLNAGFRFGITTSSDSHFTEIAAIQGPGTSRSLVFRRDASERATLDALRAGRTTTANGATAPILTLEGAVGDADYTALAGDEIVVPEGGAVRLRVRIQRGAGTTVLVYASPGRSAGPIATYRPVLPDETYELKVPVRGPHSWWRAEARGVSVNAGLPSDPDGPVSVQAATSALFADTGAPAVPRPELPVPPQDRRPDGAVRVVGGAGRFAGFGDVARTGAATHVVAERHDGGATRVVYRRLPGGTEVDLAPSSRTARLPRVAADGDRVAVVWQDERAGQVPHRPDVYLRTSADGGRTWGAERRITAGPTRDERPAVALLSGMPVVAWQSNDPAHSGGAFEVVVRVGAGEPVAVSVPGKIVDPGNTVDDRSARYPASLFPRLAVTPAGVFVVWQDDRTDPDPLFTGHLSIVEGEAPDGTDPDNWEVLAAVRTSSGAWSAPVPVSRSPTTADEHPDVAVDRDGVLHAVWDSRVLKSSGVDPAVRASRSSDGGRSWSVSVPVGFAAQAFSHRPRVGVDPDGAVRALWYDNRAHDWRWRLATATLGRTGWSNARLLTSNGSSTWPALSAGMAVFTSDRGARRVQRDITSEVYALELAPAGAPAPRHELPPPSGRALPATGGQSVVPVLAGVTAAVAASMRRWLRAAGEEPRPDR